MQVESFRMFSLRFAGLPVVQGQGQQVRASAHSRDPLLQAAGTGRLRASEINRFMAPSEIVLPSGDVMCCRLISPVFECLAAFM